MTLEQALKNIEIALADFMCNKKNHLILEESLQMIKDLIKEKENGGL